jgi:hypothetical protein
MEVVLLLLKYWVYDFFLVSNFDKDHCAITAMAIISLLVGGDRGAAFVRRDNLLAIGRGAIGGVTSQDFGM